MGNHHRYRSRPQRGYEHNQRRDEREGYSRRDWTEYRRDASIVRPVSFTAIVVGLVAWTLAAGIGYFAADLVLNWVMGSQGAIMTAGKDAATLFGIGAEVGIAVDAFANTGLVGQILGLLRLVLLPAMIAIWLLGAILLVAVPSLIARFAGRLARSRH